MRLLNLLVTVLVALPVIADANDADNGALAADPASKPSFNLRDPAVREIVRKAAGPAMDAGRVARRIDDREIPASAAAQKMAPHFARAAVPGIPQESTCVPVASAGSTRTEMQHVGIASDPLQSWVATQAGYTKGSVGGGSWPCTTRDAGLPSPWTK